MRNLRSIIMLLVVALALAAAHLTMSRWHNLSKPMVVPTLASAEAQFTEMTLERRGEAPIRLKRGDREWSLEAPYRAKADAVTVLKLVDALVNARVSDSIDEADLAALSKTRADFGLTEPLVSITLGCADGSHVVLSFGNPTPAGDGVYVAKSQMPLILIVDLDTLSRVDIAAERFRNHSVMCDAGSQVVEFDIRNGRSQVCQLMKSADGWRSATDKAMTSQVEDFLRRLADAEVKSFVWPVGGTNEGVSASVSLLSGYGLDAESAVAVLVRCADGSNHELLVGRECEDGSVYALAQDGAAIVTVDVGLKDALLGASGRFFDLRLFPLEAKAVPAFSVTMGATRYSFAREASGGWRLESPIVAPADIAFVDAMLSRLLSLTRADVVSNGVQVAMGAESKVYEVAADRAIGSVGMIAARSLEVLSVDGNRIRRLSRSEGGKLTSVTYDRDRRAWNMDGESAGNVKPDEKGIASVLAALAPLVAERVVSISTSAAELTKFGLDRPALTIAIDGDFADSPRRNLLIGSSAAKGGRYVTVGSSDAVFIVSDEAVRRLSASLVF